ncbi:MAG: hypothetical protein AAF519_16385, partial [Bacteroidota bacterium]
MILPGVFVFTLIAVNPVPGQDVRWLKSWNEAYKSKPEALSSISRIASEEEPGIPFVIKGKVFTPEGSPAKNVIVHAYHRDVQGFDFGKDDKKLSTWRLQGWVKTDAKGSFQFNTIRPAPDHLGREGAHIHFTLLTEKFGRQWAPTVYFADDPKVKADKRERAKKAGKFSWLVEVSESKGGQFIQVNIQIKKQSDF